MGVEGAEPAEVLLKAGGSTPSRAVCVASQRLTPPVTEPRARTDPSEENAAAVKGSLRWVPTAAHRQVDNLVVFGVLF